MLGERFTNQSALASNSAGPYRSDKKEQGHAPQRAYKNHKGNMYPRQNSARRESTSKSTVYPGATESNDGHPYSTSYMANGLAGHEYPQSQLTSFSNTAYAEPASANSSTSPIYGPPTILIAHITTFATEGATIDTVCFTYIVI